MTVYDLNEDQLDLLKQQIFYDDDLLAKLSEKSEEVCKAKWYFEIPDEIVLEEYEGIEFVEEDFCISKEDM